MRNLGRNVKCKMKQPGLLSLPFRFVTSLSVSQLVARSFPLSQGSRIHIAQFTVVILLNRSTGRKTRCYRFPVAFFVEDPGRPGLLFFPQKKVTEKKCKPMVLFKGTSRTLPWTMRQWVIYLTIVNLLTFSAVASIFLDFSTGAMFHSQPHWLEKTSDSLVPWQCQVGR